jgi:hypothetical protein
MAVSWVRELNRYDWEEDSEGNEQATIEYEIFVDDYTTSISTILAHASVPARRSAHPENSFAKCITRSFKRVDDFDDLIILTCVFSTKPDAQQDNNDPVVQLIKGGMRSSSVEVPAYYDALGYPLVNDAGDLFTGVTRKSRRRTVNVTANFDSVPDFLFQLSDTINGAAVTILGRTYPAWTCLLTNVAAPDEPTTSKDGVEYWPITYDIEINPEGYWVLFPNKGLHELVYQTRTATDEPWTDTTYALYAAEGSASLKQTIKRRIATVEQQDVGDDIWLDHRGQAVKVISLTTSTLAGGAMTAGDRVLTVSGGLDAETHVGCLVVVPGAGLRGKRFVSTITSVGGATSCTVADQAKTTVSGKAVSIPGARFKAFQLEEIADWSSVPLPNNQP